MNSSLSVASSCATAVIALSFLSAPAAAATIVGGSDLLSAADANQLEAWLGQGSVTLTNTYDKALRDTSEDFHAAADGKGATFTIIQVVGIYNGDYFDTPVVIGGYNPQSWRSDGGYNASPLDAYRTAFVFNLTLGLKFDQRKDAGTTNRGVYQTFNDASYGPTFGHGFDIGIGSDLNTGYTNLYSYGTNGDFKASLALYPNESEAFDSTFLRINQIEVFTVSAVPEPEAWVLMFAGLGALSVVATRRRRNI